MCYNNMIIHDNSNSNNNINNNVVNNMTIIII